MPRFIAATLAGVMALTFLAACAPEVPEVPEKTFDVVAYIDGEIFQPDQQILFDALTPNQTQSKEIRVENLSNQDVLVTNISLIVAGTLFESDDVRVEVVQEDGNSFDGLVLSPGEEAFGSITLTTTDALQPGLTGTVSLGFDAAPSNPDIQ